MKITRTVDLDGAPATAFAIRMTEEFQEQKCRDSRAIDYAVEIVAHGGGGVISTVRSMSTSDFPDAARKFVGEKIVIREVQTWDAPLANGSQRAELKIGIEGAPLTLSGTLTVAPDGAGSRQQLAADLKAGIPLMGGKIEKMAAPAIEAGFDLETALLRRRLAAG